MKRNLIILFALLFCAGCYKIVYTNSYILGFHDIQSMGAIGKYVSIGDENYVRVNVHVKTARMVTDVFGDRVSENGSYKELCKKYGDVSYRKRSLSTGANLGTPNGYSWPNADIREIEVISNDDWDATHPAGSLLNDIAWFTSTSLYPFIKDSYSGFSYKPEEWSEFYQTSYRNIQSSRDWETRPVDKLLSKIYFYEIYLLGFGGQLTQPGGLGYEEPDMLYFKPDIDSDYDPWVMTYNMFALYIPKSDTLSTPKLTITITDENSRVFTFDVEME